MTSAAEAALDAWVTPTTMEVTVRPHTLGKEGVTWAAPYPRPPRRKGAMEVGPPARAVEIHGRDGAGGGRCRQTFGSWASGPPRGWEGSWGPLPGCLWETETAAAWVTYMAELSTLVLHVNKIYFLPPELAIPLALTRLFLVL